MFNHFPNHASIDEQYSDLVIDVLEEGANKGDRTQTGTKAVVGRMMHLNLINNRQPRLTTKLVNPNPEEEMFWFLSGTSSIKPLRDKKIGIWNSWLMPGTAQFRPMTEDEVKQGITKAYLAKYGEDTVTQFAKSPVWEAGDYAEHSSEDDDNYRKVFYTDLTSLHTVFKNITGHDAVFLTDGDIGKGGYGPQWRHWQDTQVISNSQLNSYLAQGYEQVTDITERNNASWKWVGAVVVHREVDQIANAINLLKTTPDSRRIIVSAWNPALTWQAALPPCHLYFQFISHELTVMQRVEIYNDRTNMAQRDNELAGHPAMVEWHWLDVAKYEGLVECADEAQLERLHEELDGHGVKRRGLYCFLLLRSNDLGLGAPFNIAQYAFLTHLVAHSVGMEPLTLVWSAVDAHIYNNHIEALEDQLLLDHKDCQPRIKLHCKPKGIDEYTMDDFSLVDYTSHPSLASRMPPAV